MRTPPKLHPVLVSVHRYQISICVLGTDDSGHPAVKEGNVYQPLGEVKRGTRVRDGLTRTVWEWREERGRHGVADNKSQAIEHMLAARGYREVTIEAAIPDLLDGLE